MLRSPKIQCANRELDLSRPRVMGILNVTPDSFSDGGRFVTQDAALYHVEEMVDAGADLIDVGGESTRPGAERPSTQLELARVIPIIEAIAARFDVIISVDTSNAEVIRQSYAAGAHLINDVRALRDPGSLEALCETQLAVCLMHMQGEPATMNQAPHYENVIESVYSFLHERVQTCLKQGIARERLIIDPGFGFGKTFAHNLQLMSNLFKFQQLDLPILMGISRKKMIGILLAKAGKVRELGENGQARLVGGLALSAWAIIQGIRIIRTHDVAATQDVLSTLWPVIQEGSRYEQSGTP